MMNVVLELTSFPIGNNFLQLCACANVSLYNAFNNDIDVCISDHFVQINGNF